MIWATSSWVYYLSKFYLDFESHLPCSENKRNCSLSYHRINVNSFGITSTIQRVIKNWRGSCNIRKQAKVNSIFTNSIAQMSIELPFLFWIFCVALISNSQTNFVEITTLEYMLSSSKTTISTAGLWVDSFISSKSNPGNKGWARK